MRVFKFGPQELPLEGPELSVGDALPDFRVVDTGLQPRTLQDYAGHVLILSVVPSLDTGVCSAQTRRFNQEAASLGDAVRVLTISMDLPFAQKRWCGNEGVDRVITLSDHREASFGRAYGTLIPALRLESRAVFVADRGGRLVHVQYVPEAAQEPDYEAAVQAARQAL
jgi:thiol peroxidase